MPASSESSRSLPSPIARGVGLAGVVLIVLFLTILSTSLLPLRLLDAAWQLRVGGALINASPFPLIGLVLLHVAANLDPQDPLLLQRRRLAAQLAAAVAIGYLLLAPLLAAANLQRQQGLALATSGGLRRDSERLQQMRQVVSSASSIPELEQRLAAVQGPRLDAADRSLPCRCCAVGSCPFLIRPPPGSSAPAAVPRPPAPGPWWGTSFAPAWPVWRWLRALPGWPGAREATFRCWRSCSWAGSACAIARRVSTGARVLAVPILITFGVSLSRRKRRRLSSAGDGLVGWLGGWRGQLTGLRSLRGIGGKAGAPGACAGDRWGTEQHRFNRRSNRRARLGSRPFHSPHRSQPTPISCCTGRLTLRCRW
jgi:hypothetical protein